MCGMPPLTQNFVQHSLSPSTTAVPSATPDTGMPVLVLGAISQSIYSRSCLINLSYKFLVNFNRFYFCFVTIDQINTINFIQTMLDFNFLL